METYVTPKGITQQMQDTIVNYLQHDTSNTQFVLPILQLLNRSRGFTILLSLSLSLSLFSALHCFLIHLSTEFQFGIGNFWIQMLYLTCQVHLPLP